MPDYYQILGLSYSATHEEINRAYKKEAFKFHPDKNEAAEAVEKFKLINDAGRVLRDPTLKREYDIKNMNTRQPQAQSHSQQNPYGYMFRTQATPSTTRTTPSQPHYFQQRGWYQNATPQQAQRPPQSPSYSYEQRKRDAYMNTSSNYYKAEQDDFYDSRTSQKSTPRGQKTSYGQPQPTTYGYGQRPRETNNKENLNPRKQEYESTRTKVKPEFPERPIGAEYDRTTRSRARNIHDYSPESGDGDGTEDAPFVLDGTDSSTKGNSPMDSGTPSMDRQPSAESVDDDETELESQTQNKPVTTEHKVKEEQMSEEEPETEESDHEQSLFAKISNLFPRNSTLREPSSKRARYSKRYSMESNNKKSRVNITPVRTPRTEQEEESVFEEDDIIVVGIEDDAKPPMKRNVTVEEVQDESIRQDVKTPIRDKFVSSKRQRPNTVFSMDFTPTLGNINMDALSSSLDETVPGTKNQKRNIPASKMAKAKSPDKQSFSFGRNTNSLHQAVNTTLPRVNLPRKEPMVNATQPGKAANPSSVEFNALADPPQPPQFAGALTEDSWSLYVNQFREYHLHFFQYKTQIHAYLKSRADLEATLNDAIYSSQNFDSYSKFLGQDLLVNKKYQEGLTQFQNSYAQFALNSKWIERMYANNSQTKGPQ